MSGEVEACECLRGLRESSHQLSPGETREGWKTRALQEGHMKKATAEGPGGNAEGEGADREKPKRQSPHRKDVGRKEEHGGRSGVRVPRGPRSQGWSM